MRSFIPVFFVLPLIFSPGMALEAQSRDADPWLFDVSLDWIGLGVDVGYKGFSLSESVDTIIHVKAMGNYESIGYYRTPLDRPYDGSLPGYDEDESPLAYRAAGAFSLEFDQGLLWNERENANGLEFFFAYNLRYENFLHDHDVRQLLFDSPRMEKDQILYNSILAGIEWKDVDQRNPHGMISGTAADASAEWGPKAFFNTAFADVDFLRLNFSARAFLPLFDVDPESEFNKFSAYACFFLSTDYSTGTSIPLYVRQTFGGKYPREGLGDALRGLEESRYDTPFKAVGSLELRANLPAIFIPELIPGLFVFMDCGYYDFVDFSESGFVASTGGGFSLSLFGAMNLTVGTAVLLNEKLVTGETWTPIYFEGSFHF